MTPLDEHQKRSEQRGTSSSSSSCCAETTRARACTHYVLQRRILGEVYNAEFDSRPSLVLLNPNAAAKDAVRRFEKHGRPCVLFIYLFLVLVGAAAIHPLSEQKK